MNGMMVDGDIHHYRLVRRMTTMNEWTSHLMHHFTLYCIALLPMFVERDDSIRFQIRMKYENNDWRYISQHVMRRMMAHQPTLCGWDEMWVNGDVGWHTYTWPNVGIVRHGHNYMYNLSMDLVQWELKDPDARWPRWWWWSWIVWSWTCTNVINSIRRTKISFNLINMKKTMFGFQVCMYIPKK